MCFDMFKLRDLSQIIQCLLKLWFPYQYLAVARHPCRLQASLACQEDWQRASSVVGSVALVASSKTYNTIMEECVCEESVCVCQIIPLTQSLSAPQPDFETDQRTWSNCLLLHWLLIIGDEEQVLKSFLLTLYLSIIIF